jgi:hypothetical protein
MCFQVLNNNGFERKMQEGAEFVSICPQTDDEPGREATDGAPLTQLAAKLGQSVTLNVPAQPVTLDLSLEEVLTVVYVLVDDIYKKLFVSSKFFRRSPNHEPAFTDAEIITLAIVAELASYESDRAWWNFIHKNFRPLFPQLCDRTRYGRRLKRLRSGLELVRQHLCFLMNVDLSRLRVVDSFPVSLCHLRRVSSSRRPFEYVATVGFCAAKNEYFYGLKVHLVTDVHGVVIDYVVTSAHVHDTKGLAYLLQDSHRSHELLEHLIALFGDKGYIGQAYITALESQFGVQMLALRKDTPTDPDRHLSSYHQLVGQGRKIIETTISVLTEVMQGATTTARSLQGFLRRLSVKMTALNLGNYLNVLLGQPVLRVSSFVN